MEGLTIDNNNNDNIPKALRKSIETSEKLQEKFSPILEQEKKMQQLVEGVNIPKFEVSTQALDAIRDWAPEHEKMGKGVTLSEDEMLKLKELL